LLIAITSGQEELGGGEMWDRLVPPMALAPTTCPEQLEQSDTLGKYDVQSPEVNSHRTAREAARK